MRTLLISIFSLFSLIGFAQTDKPDNAARKIIRLNYGPDWNYSQRNFSPGDSLLNRANAAGLLQKPTIIATLASLTATQPSSTTATFEVSDPKSGGQFRFVPTSAGLTVDGGVVLPAPGGFYVRQLRGQNPTPYMFGAQGNTVADDTDPVQAWVTYVISQTRTQAYGDGFSGLVLELPPGSFRLTRPEVLLPASFTTKRQGYVLRGAGSGLTQIVFNATTGSRTLLSVNNSFLNSRVEGITFTSLSNANTYMHAHSDPGQGAVQDWTHQDVVWDGAWGNIIHLTGLDNNSEYKFNQWAVHGQAKNLLYIPNDNTASDQHLNYWFSMGKFWPTFTDGTNDANCMINIGRGGHVHIDKLDASGLQSGTLFKLKGSSHAYGVESFSVRDSRVELKSNNTKVIECEWARGTVIFDNFDESSQALVYSSGTVAHEFSGLNVPGPSVVLRDSRLLGKMRFSHGTNDFEQKKSVRLQNCQHDQFNDIFDMFDFVASVNDYGAATVELQDGCRGKNERIFIVPDWQANTPYTAGTQRRSGNSVYEVVTAGTSGTVAIGTKATSIADGSVVWKWAFNQGRDYVTDGVVNGLTTLNAPGMKRRMAVIAGEFPAQGGSRELILPPNCIILSARLQSPAGAVSSGNNATYTVSQDNGTAILATDTPNASAGFDAAWSGFVRGGSDVRSRTVILKSGTTVDQYNTKAILYIEYM